MWLASYYLGSQLETGLLLRLAVECESQHTPVGGLPAVEVIHLFQREMLESREAWFTVCQEYNVQPDVMLWIFPWALNVRILESEAEAFNRFDAVELSGLTERCDDYRRVIKEFSHGA